MAHVDNIVGERREIVTKNTKLLLVTGLEVVLKVSEEKHSIWQIG